MSSASICVICGQIWVGGRIEYPESSIERQIGRNTPDP
jgi:hypothetical protein